MMFAAQAASTTLTRSITTSVRSSSRCVYALKNGGGDAVLKSGQRRTMSGGGHWMSVSREHTIAGEVCGFLTWMWVFYRAKNDLPVVLGWRHPFEHAHDPWAIHDHVHNESKLQEEWEGFFVKSTKPGEDDDEDEEEEEDDDDDE